MNIQQVKNDFENWVLLSQATVGKLIEFAAAIQPAGDAECPWEALRAEVLHGLDGFDNDQTNAVLALIDFYAPAASAPAQPEPGCGATCKAAAQDGIICPTDSCDFEDGTRAPAQPEAKSERNNALEDAACLVLAGCGFNWQEIANAIRKLKDAAPVPAAPADKGELPQLPEQDHVLHVTDSETIECFRADQMHAYARACILADRARQAAIAEPSGAVDGLVLVKKTALDWMKKYNPAMCQKADMREMSAPQPPASTPAEANNFGPECMAALADLAKQRQEHEKTKSLNANIDHQMAIIDAQRIKRRDRRQDVKPVEFDRRASAQDRRENVRREVVRRESEK